MSSLYSLSRALMRNKWIKWFSDLLMQQQASQAHVVMLPNEALIFKGKLHLTELPKRKRSLKKLWPRWNTNNVCLVIIMCPGVRNTSKHEFTSDFSLCNFVIALPLRGKIFNSFFFTFTYRKWPWGATHVYDFFAFSMIGPLNIMKSRWKRPYSLPTR